MANHYYNSTGAPTYTVKGKNGKQRPTTVVDAKKLNLVPSYSTITSVLDKPGVNIWMQNQIMDAALEWPYTQNTSAYQDGTEESIKEWKQQIKEIANKLGQKGRDRGTMVHDALERCYKGEEIESELYDLIHPVIALIKHTFGLLEWVAEASFSNDGYGGKVDLHTQQEGGILIDFKTKDVDNIKKMAPYPEDVMQHAAYRDGLGIPNAKCYSLFINVRRPGMLVLHEWKEEDIQRAKRMFLCLRDFWYFKNKMEVPG